MTLPVAGMLEEFLRKLNKCHGRHVPPNAPDYTSAVNPGGDKIGRLAFEGIREQPISPKAVVTPYLLAALTPSLPFFPVRATGHLNSRV